MRDLNEEIEELVSNPHPAPDDVRDVVNRLQQQLEMAHGRIYDMALCDDGQAFSEATRYLERYAPKHYQKLRRAEMRQSASGSKS